MDADEVRQIELTKRLEKRLGSSHRLEHILNIIKAALATAPFSVGIASLMTDYIPSARLRRLERFAADVAQDLRRLEARINEQYIHTY